MTSLIRNSEQRLFAHIRNLNKHYPQCIPGCECVNNCAEFDEEMETTVNIEKGSVAFSRMPSWCITKDDYYDPYEGIICQSCYCVSCSLFNDIHKNQHEVVVEEDNDSDDEDCHDENETDDEDCHDENKTDDELD